MELSNQQTLPVSQQIAWEALNDVTMLQAAIPGCESMKPTEPDQYEVIVVAAIGPVKAKFKGKLKLSEIDAPTSYVINFDGQGGTAGHGKGSATVTLAADGPAQTTLSYTARAQVGGKIAQIGSRLVDLAAQKMAAEFFANFTQALQERYGPAAAPEQAPQTAPGALAASASAPGMPSMPDTSPPAEASPSATPPASAAARILGWLRRLFGG